MKYSKFAGFAVTAALLGAPALAMAADEGATIFKTSCMMCHGADGSKTAMKNRSLKSAEVQAQSDAELTAIVTNGKPPKMPAYGKKLTPDKVKAVVAYLRTLK
jgi:mono/diheme cytochrome c family protein